MKNFENLRHEQHTGCHCGFNKHLSRLRAKTGKRLGIFGVTLMVGHFLFHVVECLVLPAILMGVGGHIAGDDALAASEKVATQGIDHNDIRCGNIVNWSFYDAWEILDLNRSNQLLSDF